MSNPPTSHVRTNSGVAHGMRKGAAELRELIAADLEREVTELRERAETYTDERSPLLEAESDALADAARRIRSGEIGSYRDKPKPEDGDRG